MHDVAMPRCGGIAIFIAATVVLLIARMLLIPLLAKYLPWENVHEMTMLNTRKLLVLAGGGGLIFLIGLIDDIKGLPAIIKLLGQIGCGIFVFAFGIRISPESFFSISPNPTFGFYLSAIFTIGWIVLITNTINLIDGLDGLAAGVAAIAGISISYASYIHGHYVVALAIIIVAGAAIGFLPFNFNPAKTFMGDSGSMFLGFMIATISIIGPAKQATLFATIVPFFVLGVPVLDSIMAIIRRVFQKRSPMAPDKKHIHHRITENGMGHKKSVIMLYGISGIMGIAATNFSRGQYFEFAGLFLIALIFIAILISAEDKKTRGDSEFKTATKQNEKIEESLRRARADLEKNIRSKGEQRSKNEND
jgi:UDP-GlcNAc:undecaprenyl-phosphate GlcNAc-1-phosphate transferase